MRVLVWVVEGTWEGCVDAARALVPAGAEATLLHVAPAEVEEAAGGALDGLLDGVGRRAARHGQGRGAFGGAVTSDHGVSGSDQVTFHGAAHDAQPDESDCAHWILVPACGDRDLTLMLCAPRSARWRECRRAACGR